MESFKFRRFIRNTRRTLAIKPLNVVIHAAEYETSQSVCHVCLVALPQMSLNKMVMTCA